MKFICIRGPITYTSVKANGLSLSPWGKPKRLSLILLGINCLFSDPIGLTDIVQHNQRKENKYLQVNRGVGEKKVDGSRHQLKKLD